MEASVGQADVHLLPFGAAPGYHKLLCPNAPIASATLLAYEMTSAACSGAGGHAAAGRRPLGRLHLDACGVLGDPPQARQLKMAPSGHGWEA